LGTIRRAPRISEPTASVARGTPAGRRRRRPGHGHDDQTRMAEDRRGPDGAGAWAGRAGAGTRARRDGAVGSSRRRDPTRRDDPAARTAGRHHPAAPTIGEHGTPRRHVAAGARAGRPAQPRSGRGDTSNVDEVVLPEKAVLILSGTSAWEEGLKNLRGAFGRVEAEIARLGTDPRRPAASRVPSDNGRQFRFEAMIPIGAVRRLLRPSGRTCASGPLPPARHTASCTRVPTTTSTRPTRP
jgi:hypothetical protein